MLHSFSSVWSRCALSHRIHVAWISGRHEPLPQSCTPQLGAGRRKEQRVNHWPKAGEPGPERAVHSLQMNRLQSSAWFTFAVIRSISSTAALSLALLPFLRIRKSAQDCSSAQTLQTVHSPVDLSCRFPPPKGINHWPFT